MYVRDVPCFVIPCRDAYKILIGKPEGKRPLGRRRHRLEDNIRSYLKEIGWEGVDWIRFRMVRSVGLL
jgi:hypothetical protein